MVVKRLISIEGLANNWAASQYVLSPGLFEKWRYRSTYASIYQQKVRPFCFVLFSTESFRSMRVSLRCRRLWSDNRDGPVDSSHRWPHMWWQGFHRVATQLIRDWIQKKRMNTSYMKEFCLYVAYFFQWKNFKGNKQSARKSDPRFLL